MEENGKFQQSANLQGTKNARKDKVKSARKENYKKTDLQKMDFARNKICK